MSAEPRIIRTKAEEEMAALFRAERQRLPAGQAAWRSDAFAQFERAGLPHRRVEAWKYTDLRALLRTVPPLAREPSREKLAGYLLRDRLPGLERARIVIVNGSYRADLSDLSEIDGVSVESLADIAVADPARIGLLFAGNADAIVALNAALVMGGVVIRIAPNAKPALPVEIAHFSAIDQPASIVSRDLIEVGTHASVRFIDTYQGPAEIVYQVNAATELSVGPGATVSWSRLQDEGSAAVHLGSLAARLDADVTFDHVIVSLGASLSRWQGFVDVAGRGTRLGLYGANMLAGKQHTDLALVVTHAEGYSSSRELFKNVVDGEAEGAFQGRIVVAPDAQKTDAKMMTQALLLSDRADFAQKPELEIFADDVQCGHGATAGRIDETSLFYLLARGIPRAEAERLLIEAFLAGAIEAIGDEAIADALKVSVGDWIARRGAMSP